LLGLVRPVAIDAAVDLEEALVVAGGLLAAQGEERHEGLGDLVLAFGLGGVRAVAREHGGPAGLREVLDVDAGLDAVVGGPLALDAVPELGEVIAARVLGRRLAGELARERLGALGREQVGAGAGVDAVEVERVAGFHRSVSLRCGVGGEGFISEVPLPTVAIHSNAANGSASSRVM
jgi:hypothetical protein